MSGTYGDPRGVGVSYERGTPVMHLIKMLEPPRGSSWHLCTQFACISKEPTQNLDWPRDLTEILRGLTEISTNTSLGGGSGGQMMLKGHLPRVIHHRVYFDIRRKSFEEPNRNLDGTQA